MIKRPPLLFYLITLIVTNSFGQTPVITHVDKYVNGNGQRVTISGSNFGGIAGDLRVWFGASQGVVETATEQTIEALVPPGATYESIVVTNVSTGKSAWSKGEFMLAYGGDDPIALAKLAAQSDLDAETGLYDLCMCDLDNDGVNDIAGSNSGATTPPSFGLSVFPNTTAPGAATLSFAAKISLLATTKALNIKCGDLNGDGLKELIVTEADPGTRVFILKNMGSMTFTPQNISVTGSLGPASPKRVDVADLDGDGLPELVITDQNTANQDLIILRNTSVGATISFGPSTLLPVASTGSDGLAIQDLNNDNRPEIIISQVLSSGGNVFVYKNESIPGDFDFDEVTIADIAPATPNNTGAPVNVRVGDIDGDSKSDIVVTHFLGSRVSVLRNTTTTGAISFAAPIALTTDVFPFGLDLGDLDGDGKLDIVIASLTGPTTEPNPKSLTILDNTSTVGSISFLPPLTQATTFVNRHVVVGDLNGDSKPDIAYTSVDDNTRGVPASKISFFRNRSCILPEVTPGGPMTICNSFPLELKSTESAGATYLWSQDGTPLGAETNPTYPPSASATYTIDITSDGCTKTSNEVEVTVSTGGATLDDIENDSPACEGGTINLSVTTTGGDTFNWTGPAGFSKSGASVNRSDYEPAFAGRYEVEVLDGGCIAAKGSTLVETISLPSFNVSFIGSDVFCTGTKTLSVVPAEANFDYQWTDENGDIGGETGTTFDASASGSYSVTATSTLYPACPVVVADAVDILKATVPVVAFESPAETCKDVLTSFTNQSTVQDGAGAQYKWEFGDGDTSTETNATHTYTALGTLDVKLTVKYRGDACTTISAPEPITISAPPTATITSEGNVFQFCPGDGITLGVSAPFEEYEWSTDETTASIAVTTGGNFSVQLTNDIGCKITVSQAVTLLPLPDITITAETNPINLGEETKLSASNGFPDYTWTPVETLDDPTSQTPIAKPADDTEYTVTVVGSNGCEGTAKLLIDVILDNPTNLLKVANFFSPNGDTSNPFWNIEPASIVQMCGVTVFDEKGLKVYEAKPYNNDWDGTSNNGKRLPDGVYYYQIRCDGDNGSKSGSITILR